MERRASVHERLLSRALSCMAIGSGLRSAVLLNASVEVLDAAAAALARRIAAVQSGRVVRTTLIADAADDTLWGAFAPRQPRGRLDLAWCPGTVGAPDECRIIVIPNLAALASHVVRFCIATVSADIIHIARHGYEAAWEPATWWLAGCPRESRRQVSDHLLDRFALSLDAAEVGRSSRRERLEDFVRGVEQGTLEHVLTEDSREQMAAATAARPVVVTRAALDAVLSYADTRDGARRGLAMARLAVAEARLRGDVRVTASHVVSAAAMLGKRPPPPFAVTAPRDDPAPLPRDYEIGPGLASDEMMPISGVSSPAVQEFSAVTPAAEPPAPMDLAPELLPPDLAPPESAASYHEATSLPPLLPPGSSGRARGGAVIGVRPARDLEDLSLIGTLLEAAKFQRVRHAHRRSPSRRSRSRTCAQPPAARPIQVLPSDLRSYRRLPPPEHMLVLLLDHTCLAGWPWIDEVGPHLYRAYLERSAVVLIEVGAGDAKGPEEYRARRTICRKVLSPVLDERLDAPRGRATPLAHGLDLALDTLRRALRHRRSKASRVRLVVLTDGRGNVPLASSRAGRLLAPVRAEGVEDALQIAERLKGLTEVERSLIAPNLQQLQSVLDRLAGALGVSIPRIQTGHAPTGDDEDDQKPH